MSKKSQYSVFSARTTPEGLKILGGLKARLGVNWDKLIIGAVNAHYGIEVPTPVLAGPTPGERAKAKATKDTEKGRRAGAKAPEPKAEKTAEDAKGRPAETAPVA